MDTAKSHSLNAEYEQTLTQKKVSSHGNFTHFHYKVKTPPEQIVLPVKENLKKTKNLRVVNKPREGPTYPADCRKIAAVDSNKHDWGLKE